MGEEMKLSLIKDIRPNIKNLNVVFIMLEIGKPTRTKENHEVRSCKIADRTGCINISLWDELGDLLQTGDICKLINGYSAIWKGCLTVYTGKIGEIQKVGEFCMTFTEVPNMSEHKPEWGNVNKDNQSGGTGPNRRSPPQDTSGPAQDQIGSTNARSTMTGPENGGQSASAPGRHPGGVMGHQKQQGQYNRVPNGQRPGQQQQRPGLPHHSGHRAPSYSNDMNRGGHNEMNHGGGHHGGNGNGRGARR